MTTEKTLFEQGKEKIESVLKKDMKDCKGTVNDTGITYFITPKQRLCKIIKTKKNLKLELNIYLSDELIKELNENQSVDFQQISKKQAKDKKLGTMKHLVIITHNELTEKIIKDMIDGYKNNRPSKQLEI